MILDRMNLRLKGKTIIGLGALLLFALLAMGGAIYYQAMTLAIDELLESAGKNIAKDAMEIEHFVEQAKKDLMVISATPPVQGIIRARDNGGIDPLTGDKTEYWLARMEHVFGAFLRYHPEYFQLRYLDEKGDEIARADRSGAEVRIAQGKELQNRSRYPCFTETLKLRRNEVYYSELNLNREHGVIQIPHAPVFRIGTPVYDANNTVRGVVVINVDAEALFSSIRTAIGKARKYVINQDGYFLVHPDRAREFGFDRGFDFRITNVLPEFADELKARDFNVKNHAEEKHVDSFKKVFFDPKNRDRWWAVVHKIPAAQAFKNVYLARNTMFAAGFIIIVVSLAVTTWISTRVIVAPVLKLTKAIHSMEIGDLAARAREDGRGDEIGDLATSFNRMAGTIEEKVKELTVLNRVIVAASTSLSDQVMANNALDAILELQLMKFEKKGAIFITDEETRTLRLAASRGFSEEQKALDAVVPFGNCLCGIAAETGEPIHSEICCDDPRHTRKYSGIPPHGHLILPLKSNENVLGLLVLYLSADTKIAPEETRLYRSIADVLAVALQNARQFNEIEGLRVEQSLILNSLGEGVYGLDAGGICTFMNPTAERMLGYGSGELTGAELHPMIHHTRPDGTVYPREECRIHASYKENAVYHVDDEVFWRKDGSGFPVEYTSTPMRNESGAATGAVVVFSDITERRRAEEGLRGYAEQYRTMLSTALFGFWLADEKGRLLSVNDTYCKMTGYTREELLNLSIPDLESVENPEDTARHIKTIIEAGRDRFESKHKAKDGRVFDVEISTSFWRSQRKFVVFISDIADRKKAEQSLQKTNRLLDAISRAQTRFIAEADPHELFDDILGDLLSLTDSEYGFIGEVHHDADGTPYLKTHAITNVAWNEKTREIYEENARRGFEFSTLKSLYGTVMATGETLITNSPSTDPRRAGIPHGHPPINAFLGLPFFSGKAMVGMVGIANRPGGYDEELAEYLQPLIATCGNIIEARRNADLRKKAEDKLKEHVETLEVRVNERTRQLENMKDQAEAASRAKSDFLANMSHELRTPLNAILGFSEVMRDGMAGPVTEEQQDYLGDVLTSGQHLLQLINDILDLSKVEAGKMELEPSEINVPDLLEGSLIMLKEKAMKHRISLKTDISPDLGAIIADERKIKQVVFNLLNNAVKFTRDGGEVGLRAERMPGKVRVTIWDTGVGIREEDLKKLFAPFSQIDSVLTRHHEGTGLGLNLSRKLLELHGGRIWAESEYGKGSRFLFDVPVEPYPPAPREPADYESILAPGAADAPVASLLRRRSFLEYLGKVAAYHRKHNLGFAVARLAVLGPAAQEGFAHAVSVLNERVRKEEIVGRGEHQTSLYIILTNVNRWKTEAAFRRLLGAIQERQGDAGHALETRLAVYPEDGEDGEALLRALNGE